jgi:type VI protein secretion system component VasF
MSLRHPDHLKGTLGSPGVCVGSKTLSKRYYGAVKKRWVSAMVFVAALVVLYIYWRLTR